MKKRVVILATVLSVTLLFGSVNSSGRQSNTESYYAGASKILAAYMAGGDEAIEMLSYRLSVLRRFSGNESGETLEPVTYEEPILGIVCTESTLNIREAPSVLSDVVAIGYQQQEVLVYGEHQIQGKLWYEVECADIRGFASADYVKFGDDVVVYYTELRSLIKNTSILPKPLIVSDDVSGLDDGSLSKLNTAVKNVKYCLQNDYPKAQASGATMNMYSILVYILENYQRILEVATAHNLPNTYEQATKDMRTVMLMRSNLTVTTGTSDAQFQKQIADAVAERERKSKYTLGEQIANYAATFVGKLPYIWGGASLTRGADCSGFCGQIYAHFGFLDQAAANRHVYDSTSLRNVGRAVSVNEIQPGDLVCYQGHVAIYWGSGMVVHEPAVGLKCSYGALHMMPIITVRRLIP